MFFCPYPPYDPLYYYYFFERNPRPPGDVPPPHPFPPPYPSPPPSPIQPIPPVYPFTASGPFNQIPLYPYTYPYKHQPI